MPATAVQYRRRGGCEFSKVPPVWKISYGDLRFQLKTMGFKHTGVFPEQAVNWDFTGNLIRNASKPLKVLNLFAYTGGATLACAQANINVCHVDASKGWWHEVEKTPRRPAFQNRADPLAGG